MLVDDDAAVASHERFKTIFGSDEVLSVAIPFPDSLSIDSLSVQQEIVHSLELLRDVERVDALVTMDDVVGTDGLIEVRPLFPKKIDRASLPEAHLSEIRARVLSHPIWRGWLISKGSGAIAIQITLADSREAEARRGVAMEEIDAVLRSALNDGEYFLAGHPFMKSEISNSIANDLARLLPISMAAMTLFLLIATRSVFVGMATAFSVLLSVIWMLGGMGFLGLDMTALTNTAPSILMALATACFLHMAGAFQSFDGVDAPTAAFLAYQKVRRPTLIAAGTTSIGYGSLSLSNVPIVREFGIALAVGMIAVALVAILLLPALLSLDTSRKSRLPLASGFGLDVVLLKVVSLVSRRSLPLFVGAIVFGALMALASIEIEVDSSGPRRFSEDSRFRVSSRFYRSQLSGDVLESVFLEGQPGDFAQPEVLRRLQKFQRAALELPEIDKTVSIADFIERTYWVFRGEEGDPFNVPDSLSAVSQLLLFYQSSSDVDSLSEYISSDFSSVRIILSADVQSSSASSQLRADLEGIASRFLPEFVSEHSVVSTEMLLSKAADVIAVEQIRSALIAFALVLLVIAISFGSWEAAAVMILPNSLPLVVNLGVMSLLDVALSDATSIISATALGIAVDSTVHLYSAVKRSQADGHSRKDSVGLAMLTTGRPVMVSSFIVIVGFSFLLSSEFGSVAELGALTASTMFYCLVADLFFLPAQLYLLYGSD